MDDQSKKEFVLQTVREIINSGEFISSKTGEPLSDTEKVDYFVRATFYFTRDERHWMRHKQDGCKSLAPSYDMLLMLLKMEGAFSETLKCTVKQICETPTRDEDEYEIFLKEVRRSLLPEDTETIPAGVHSENLNEMQLIKKVWGHLEDNVVGYLSGSPVVKAVASSVVDEIALACQGTIQPYNIAAGVRGTAMFSSLYLCGTIGYNVYQVVRCGRSWKRAAKNITEETVAVVSGAVAGITISAILAPFTAGISLICGALFGLGANLAIRPLTKKYTGPLFNIPEDEMLEKAYATLDTDQLTENKGISKAYRQKSRQFHPDKVYAKFPDATQEEKNRYLMRYLKVQAAFGMIMAARKNDIDEYENARKHFERIDEDELRGKSCIDINIKVWAANQARKLWSYCVTTKNRFSYASILDGILPYDIFVETEESEVEEAVAARNNQRETDENR